MEGISSGGCLFSRSINNGMSTHPLSAMIIPAWYPGAKHSRTGNLVSGAGSPFSTRRYKGTTTSLLFLSIFWTVLRKKSRWKEKSVYLVQSVSPLS